jgi:cobalt-precorrin-5B (C1)-methyltransferase
LSGMTNGYRSVLGEINGLRRGFTTGTSAQAAAMAAAELLEGIRSENHSSDEGATVSVCLPKVSGPFNGARITVPLVESYLDGETAVAAVRKDAGDDDDVTGGLLFRARVRRIGEPTIRIVGGEGVGRVTKPGLPVKPGEWAINPVPRRMIRTAVTDLVTAETGVEVEISVPEGAVTSRETWNPRLGIEGGISILGTTGVVEPKSQDAFKTSITVMVKVLVGQTPDGIAVTPGYVGETFLYDTAGVPESRVATVGDHIGFTLDAASRFGCRRVLLAGHLSKLAKVASGIFDTHSKYGDARLETIAAMAAASGAGESVVRELLDLRLAEAAVAVLRREGLSETYELLCRRIIFRAEERVRKEMEVGVVLTALDGTPLGAVPEYLMERDGWKRFLS